MAKVIEIKDWSCKHTTYVYTSAMKPLGWIHQEAAIEWKAYKPCGEFINWFTSKKAAMAAIGA